MGDRTDWRLHRLRRGPECATEMAPHTICSSEPLAPLTSGNQRGVRGPQNIGCRVTPSGDPSVWAATPLARSVPAAPAAAGTLSSDCYGAMHFPHLRSFPYRWQPTAANVLRSLTSCGNDNSGTLAAA